MQENTGNEAAAQKFVLPSQGLYSITTISSKPAPSTRFLNNSSAQLIYHQLFFFFFIPTPKML